jgi:hypothetical protein
MGPTLRRRLKHPSTLLISRNAAFWQTGCEKKMKNFWKKNFVVIVAFLHSACGASEDIDEALNLLDQVSG